MKIVIDTSVIIAVITNEEHKNKLIQITKGSDLMAPSCLHWEIGNAFSAMFKRNRISLDDAQTAIGYYNNIPIRFIDVELKGALDLSYKHSIYAYDAYFLECTRHFKAHFLSLNEKLNNLAKKLGLKIIEV